MIEIFINNDILILTNVMSKNHFEAVVVTTANTAI